MITDGKPFDTNIFFSGGAGMLIQYHDIIRSVHLYAIIKMILNDDSFGLPINIIKDMSILSIIEWYVKRRYKNPFKCLDYKHYLDDNQINAMLLGYTLHDKSLYELSPLLNTAKLFDVYRKQQMIFPIYIYSEIEEPNIKEDCKNLLQGIQFSYVFGNLEDCIKQCNQNFTYIFSDIELVKKSSEILTGTCSHILLSREYRYNYIDNCKTFKYDLEELANKHPFVRIGTITSVDIENIIDSFDNIRIKYN